MLRVTLISGLKSFNSFSQQDSLELPTNAPVVVVFVWDCTTPVSN